MSQEQYKLEYEELLRLEEITWRQKSRVTWLREGDKNTRFCHRVANSNRRFNSIDRLSIDGVQTTDQAAIGEGLVQFYSTLFSDEAVRAPCWMGCLSHPLMRRIELLLIGLLRRMKCGG